MKVKAKWWDGDIETLPINYATLMPATISDIINVKESIKDETEQKVLGSRVLQTLRLTHL